MAAHYLKLSTGSMIFQLPPLCQLKLTLNVQQKVSYSAPIEQTVAPSEVCADKPQCESGWSILTVYTQHTSNLWLHLCPVNEPLSDRNNPTCVSLLMSEEAPRWAPLLVRCRAERLTQTSALSPDSLSQPCLWFLLPPWPSGKKETRLLHNSQSLLDSTSRLLYRSKETASSLPFTA